MRWLSPSIIIREQSLRFPPQRINDRLLTLLESVNVQYLLLTLVTIIAVLLRFYKLGEWSFWGDEAITLDRAKHLFAPFEMQNLSTSTVLIHLTLQALDANEWSTRLVPALVGVLSVPILYFPIKKLTGPAVALLASLLLAVSPWHLYWSQNARFYTMLLLLYTLALFYFYFAIEEDKPQYLLLSMILLGLAAFERLVALLFVPVVLSYLGLLKILPFETPPGLRWRNLALFFVPGLLGGLVIALPHLNPTVWLRAFGTVNNNPFWILAGVAYYIRLPVILMGGVGAFYMLLRRDRASLLLVLGALVPLLAIMAVSLFHYTANRYVFISLVCWLVLAAVAVVELLRNSPQRVHVVAAGVLLLVLLDPLAQNVLYYKYQNGNRDNWKAAFALVRDLKRPEEQVFIPQRLLGDYYLPGEAAKLSKLTPAMAKEVEGYDGGYRFWLIEDMTVQRGHPFAYDWIHKHGHLIDTFDVHVDARNFKMRVWLYDAANQRDTLISR